MINRLNYILVLSFTLALVLIFYFTIPKSIEAYNTKNLMIMEGEKNNFPELTFISNK